MTISITAWGAAIAAWSCVLVATAQHRTTSAPPVMFDESMNRGLLPLFGFVAAGMVMMTLAALLTVLVLRARIPRSLRRA